MLQIAVNPVPNYVFRVGPGSCIGRRPGQASHFKARDRGTGCMLCSGFQNSEGLTLQHAIAEIHHRFLAYRWLWERISSLASRQLQATQCQLVGSG